MLAAAKSPVIFAGCGVDRSCGNVALVELAELIGCPVIPSLAGRSVMPHEHPLCFLSQSPAADELRRARPVVGDCISTILCKGSHQTRYIVGILRGRMRDP